MCGAPQSGFARLISPMSVRSSAETFGLPTWVRDRQRQYARNPVRLPANDGLRPDNRNGAKDRGEPVIKPNKQKTIGIVEGPSFRCPPAKHVDLLPQDQDFCFQLCSRLEEQSQYTENQLEQILHPVANLPRLFSASMLNRIFGTHRNGEDLIFDFNFQALGVPVSECFEAAFEKELRVGKYLKCYLAEHYSLEPPNPLPAAFVGN
jgi:hypothetical protein